MYEDGDGHSPRSNRWQYVVNEPRLTALHVGGDDDQDEVDDEYDSLYDEDYDEEDEEDEDDLFDYEGEPGYDQEEKKECCWQNPIAPATGARPPDNNTYPSRNMVSWIS